MRLTSTPLLGTVMMLTAACSTADADPRVNSPPDTSPASPASPATPPTSPDDPAGTATASPSKPPELLPDLANLPADDVHITIEGGVRQLRFSATITNTGVGPIAIVPDESQPCPARRRFASQLTHLDADDDDYYSPTLDTEQVVTPAGCMVDHPTHDHWHFEASSRYVLTAPADDTPIVASDKVSFCLRDSDPLPGTTRAEVYDDCEYDSVQGITPGWADVYESDLDGQALPLPPGLADGAYCLTLGADPNGLLRESVEDNNAATIGVQITGNTATAVAPRGCVPPAPPRSVNAAGRSPPRSRVRG